MSTTEFSNSKSDLPAKEGLTVAQIVALLKAEIGDELFELWFSHTECIAIESRAQHRIVRVQADNDFSVRRIQQTYHATIRSIVDRVCGPESELIYLVVADEADVTGDSESESPTSPDSVQQSLAFPAQLEADGYASRSIRRLPPSLSTFCFPAEGKLLKAGVAQMLVTPGQFTPFFVHGPTGSGKTHLLEAIVTEFRRKLRLKRCIYVSAEEFTTQFLSSLRGSGLPMFRRKFRDLDLLAIDDIQFLAGKKATLNEFQQTLDNLVRLGKQVVLSADRSAMELADLGADICTRISAGLACATVYPDLEGRQTIARRMCSARDCHLPPGVIELLCEKLPRDVRRLSGAINRLHAYSKTFGDQITVEFAHDVLSDLFKMSGPVCTSIVSIEQAVCELCGVKSAELRSSSRQKRISTARMLAMYLSRKYTGSAFSEIGDYFGGRSHSTVISAERKVKQWIESNSDIRLPQAQYTAREAIERLESNLRVG